MTKDFGKCDFTQGCKRSAVWSVVHKAVGAMAERRVKACDTCAHSIGKNSIDWGGPVINRPNRESRFYRIEEMV